MTVHTANTPEVVALETRLDTALTTIARLATHLDDLMAGYGRVPRFGEIRRRNPRSAPPCNLSWLQFAIELQDVLTCGVVQARADGVQGKPVSRDGVVLAWWLARRVPYLAGLGWVDSPTWWGLRAGTNGQSWLDEIELYADTLEQAVYPPEKHPPAGTAREVALWCGVNQDTVRQWRHRGKVRGFKQGGKWLYRTADIEAAKATSTRLAG